MTRLLPTALVGALVAGLVGVAQAAEPMRMHHGAPMRRPTSADRAFAASNDAMMKGMEVKPSGDVDRDFVAMMLPHHRGAVDMARIELRYGRDPTLRKLAAAVVAAQDREIALMRAWQEKHAR